MAPKIKHNTKHLSKGDPLPPYNGKLRLFNMRFCPFAHRAVLALIAKNVNYEVINIDLVDKPEWFIARSNFSKVPALEIEDGVTIVESLVVAQYLDDVYPQRPLVAKDPVTKAFDQIIVESSLEYIKNMKEDSIVKEYALPVEAFHEYHRTYTLGAKPNYNLLLE